MTSIPKSDIIRLKGEPKKRLQLAVSERDGNRCQTCGGRTEAPPHHILYVGQGGSDIASNMCIECLICHDEIHHGDIKNTIERMITFYGAKHVIRYFLMGVLAEKEGRNSETIGESHTAKMAQRKWEPPPQPNCPECKAVHPHHVTGCVVGMARGAFGI